MLLLEEWVGESVDVGQLMCLCGVGDEGLLIDCLLRGLNHGANAKSLLLKSINV